MARLGQSRALAISLRTCLQWIRGSRRRGSEEFSTDFTPTVPEVYVHVRFLAASSGTGRLKSVENSSDPFALQWAVWGVSPTPHCGHHHGARLDCRPRGARP